MALEIVKKILDRIKDLKGLFGRCYDWKSLTLRGGSEFINKTIEALNLLMRELPDVVKLIEENVSDISEGSNTRAKVKVPGKRSWCIIGREDYLDTTTSYASVLAHEAFHCMQYRKYQTDFPNANVPKESYSGERAEKEALDYMVIVLKKLGAPTDEINWYQNEAMKTRWWENKKEDKQ